MSSKCWSARLRRKLDPDEALQADRNTARARLSLRARARRAAKVRGPAVHSLSRRLLLAVSVPLALFFGVMMFVLDSGFRELSERSLRELLDAQMVSLIAGADPMPDGGYAPPPAAPRAAPGDAAFGPVRADPLGPAPAGAPPRPRASPRTSVRCSRAATAPSATGPSVTSAWHWRVALSASRTPPTRRPTRSVSRWA